MKIIQVETAYLKPSEYNPRRKLTIIEKEQIKISLEKFGFVEPIIVNSNESRKNIIIGGHQRYEIAKEQNIESLPVHYVDIENIELEKELNIRLNRNHGGFDYEKLLEGFDEEFLLGVGFEPKEIIFEEQEEVNYETEWMGMPGFHQQDKTAYKSIHIHFKDEAAVKDFSKKLNVEIKEKTRYLHYPERMREKMKDKQYE